MFTHKMCESCSINIQLSKELPSLRFLKQFHKTVHIALFSILIDMRKPLWTLLAVPNKMPFFYTLYSALECCYSFLALPCVVNIPGGVLKMYYRLLNSGTN